MNRGPNLINHLAGAAATASELGLIRLPFRQEVAVALSQLKPDSVGFGNDATGKGWRQQILHIAESITKARSLALRIEAWEEFVSQSSPADAVTRATQSPRE